MYLYDKNRITYFAETDRRNKRVPFGIKAEDRTRHMYIIGKTGMGKSTCIENMVVQDIKNGEGIAFIDPHGKSAALLLDYIPPERIKDVVYFAPFDSDYPISFNVMEDVGPDKRHLVANGLMSAFKKIFGAESFSDRMQYILMNCLLALLEYPDSTLLGVNRMLTDKVYRKKVVDNVKDPSVKAYWVEEFAKYTEKFAAEATPAVQNKLGQFTSNPLIRNIIGQPHSSFDLRKMMDERKILIVNLSKGQLGEGNAALLGGMIITKIYLAAMSRADLTEGDLSKLPNFYMYVDEFQNFANESFADILSEARKYKLALTVANQYIKQMDEKVADAVFGNVGTQVMFRVGAPDAEVLEKEYAPVFTAEDMVSLGFTQIYLKLMIDGVASHPFSAVTIGPIAPPKKSLRDEVLASSRALYGRQRAEVEKSITEWFGTGNETSSKSEPSDSSAKTPRAVPTVAREEARQTQPGAPRERMAPRVDASPRAPYQSSQASTPVGRSTQTSNLPVVARNSNAKSEQPVVRQNQSLLRREEPQKQSTQTLRPGKFEKPFAQAFKDVVIPEPAGLVARPEPAVFVPQSESFKKETPKAINLSVLAQSRPARDGVIPPIKSKGPTLEGLSSLKAALAGVLDEEKKKPVPQSSTAIPQVSTRPIATQKETESTREEKKSEEPVTPSQKPPQHTIPQPLQASSFIAGLSSAVGPKEVPQEEKREVPKVKEVPEDVLMAILRGDD